MVSKLVEPEARKLYRTLLDEVPSEVLVSGASSEAVEQLVAVLRELDDPPVVRILASEDVLKPTMNDFLIASAAADLTAANQLLLRTDTTQPEEFLFLTENAITLIVAGDSQTAGVVIDDSAFVEDVSGKYTTAWKEAEDFALRTPSISRIRESIDDALNPAIRVDFDAMVRSLETARGDGDGLDAVTISLLVAAKNEALLYDLGKWGEDIGLTSRTTFSRVKTDLEELGILDTEKVPTNVGRPRQRLVLGDERLQDAEPRQLASIARDILPETTT